MVTEKFTDKVKEVSLKAPAAEEFKYGYRFGGQHWFKK